MLTNYGIVPKKYFCKETDYLSEQSSAMIEDGFYDNIAEVRADPIYAKASDDEARRMIGEIKYLDKNNDGKIRQKTAPSSVIPILILFMV